MSGTSLDGLDIAYCIFEKKKSWSVVIGHAETIKYNKQWQKKLSSAMSLHKEGLLALDKEYGIFIGKQVAKFIRDEKVKVDFIASHGHTIFHQPQKGITLQIGAGEQIAALCNLPVIYNFRSGDVALGGQGAPLVPIVDKMLFSKHMFCLNLGGFANISYDKNNKRIAFDICPVNIVLNTLSNKLGKEFDRGGKMASKGMLHAGLLKKLNALSFYKAKPPKSLGREWVESKFLPALQSFNIPVKDKLRTVVEHVAIQIAAVNSHGGKAGSFLVTGGGGYNHFLVERISFHTDSDIILPGDKLIQFKEAMAFALLGTLKMRGEINILKCVTGAKRDSSGGEMYFPGQNAESSS